ncbi:MAG: isoleucine--tRNA ligase [Bacteroidales bacterium]|nr:isoleucine--tRNA ligase [Bacteroidales bacterium]
MMKKFQERSKLNLSEVNNEVLAQWNAEDVFHKSISEREGYPEFIFFEGPPSANGMPGIHHVMARTIKDVVCRYKTLTGHKVDRKAGWDTHGLPVELGVEKTLGITKEDIGKKISVKDYNDTCRREVMKYTSHWTDLTERVGYWVDLENPYITYDNRYIETLWWLLKQLYNKNLLYKGYTIQPYSPAAGTGLSTHELNQPGCYRDVKDTTVTAQFAIVDPKPEMTGWGKPYFIAWTTTPWTLPSNTALCVGRKIEYVAVRTYNMYNGEPVTVVMAKERVNAYLNPQGAELPLEEYKHGDKVIPYRIVAEYTGEDLLDMHYEQIFPWVKPADGAFRVIPGDYVTTEDGTGIVHIAPTFGADDNKVAKAAGIPPLVMIINSKGDFRPMVDRTGKFFLMSDLDPEFVKNNINVDLYSKYEGCFVKNAYDPKYNVDGKYDAEAAAKDEDLNIRLCIEMKQDGKAFKIEKHLHNYPHCWRTDKPVLYYPLDSWFIKSTAMRDRMIELNKTINWKPQSTGEGRFGKWLENLVDWNLSRSRYWGTPLPIWSTEDASERKCIGSVEELYAEMDKSIAKGYMKEYPWKNFEVGKYTKENYENLDLHRPYVDEIVLVASDGRKMFREPDLIDVWFDSGAMPYAQWHYPFENKDRFDKLFPADFIAEGVDQTRGWFFTLHAIATMIFDSVAYKNIISNGLVLDKNGNKMSKRLGNAVNPFETIDKYGADPVRWYMITNAQAWDNLKFDIAGVDEVKRKFFGTLYNTYNFFAMYANTDNFTYAEPDVPFEKRPELDRWILSLLNTLVKEVGEAYETYENTKAGRLIQTFVMDHLSNWYVRLGRKRYWGGEYDEDKISAYQTLYTCLITIAKIASPIAPFYMDKMYRDLNAVTGKENYESVHLAYFPKVNEQIIDKSLEERMEMAQTISSMILGLRRKVSIKVRQPLQKIMVPSVSDDFAEQMAKVEQIIKTETNIKEIQILDDSSDFLVKKIKANFKVLGPRYGKIMKQVANAISQMSQKDIASLERNDSFTLNVEGQEVAITTADVEINSEDIPGWLVANEGKYTVALDINVTPELVEEGIAREFVNRIQNIRKDSNFDITDRIRVKISSTAELDTAVNHYREYICGQTLANSIEIVANVENGTEIDVNDVNVTILVTKE